MAANEEMTIKSITKFNGTNFQVWKFQMNKVLVSLKLKGIVDGSDKRPQGTSDADKASQEAWDINDARAVIILSSSMTEEQVENIITCDTAYEIWEQLSSLNKKSSETNKIVFLHRFHQCSMGKNDTMIQYITKIENMARQLKDVGEQISDDAVMAKILRGLPVQYGSFVNAWDSTKTAKQTVSNMQERLLKEEKRLEKEDIPVNAFVSARSNSN